MTDDGALVLFSGGQDSATCLAWALDRFAHVETIGFDYRQRHRIELEVRRRFRDELVLRFPAWAKKLGPDHLLDVPVLGSISDTALTTEAEIAFSASGLPNTFVPGRNLLFLTFAAAIAYRRGEGEEQQIAPWDEGIGQAARTEGDLRLRRKGRVANGAKDRNI